MATRAWTADEDAVLRRMHDAGIGWEVCATALGRTASACISRWHELSPARTACSRRGRAWTQEEDGILTAMVKDGRTWSEISRRLSGRSPKSCNSRACTLGLAKRKPAKREPPVSELSRRRCHDCGKPTTDYRCPQCLAAFRARNGVSLNAAKEEDGGYTVFGSRWAID